MSKTDPINTGVPPDTGESPALGAGRIRALARAVIELFAKNHYTGTSSPYNEDAAGEHTVVTLRKQTSDPANEAEKYQDYCKDVGSGVIEKFGRDAAGNIIQFTDAGKTRQRSSDNILANANYLKARNAADDGNVNLIKAGRNEANNADVAVLPDAVRTATNAAPAEDTGIVNKKTLDDVAATKSGLMTPAIYAGEESVTYPNGEIVKRGLSVTITHSSYLDKVFATPFPGGVASAIATVKYLGATGGSLSVYVTNLNKLGMRLVLDNAGNSIDAPAYWEVRGY